MEKLTPLGNNVIVKPLDEMIVSKGGIYIPETAQEKPHEAEVIAVGPGRTNKAGKLVPMDVKVGDRVIYAKYTGSEIKMEGVKYLIMPETEILALKINESAGSESKAKGK